MPVLEEASLSYLLRQEKRVMMRHIFQSNFEHRRELFDASLFRAVIPSIKWLSSHCDFFFFFMLHLRSLPEAE